MTSSRPSLFHQVVAASRSANLIKRLTSWNCEDTEPQLGTHLVAPRHGYQHHGIYAGDGKVMHYAGLCRSPHSGPVEEVSIARFAAGQEIWIKPSTFPKYVGQQAVGRARSRLEENRYRLLSNNCEHFCTWCAYGKVEANRSNSAWHSRVWRCL
jgi:hypothetical protein